MLIAFGASVLMTSISEPSSVCLCGAGLMALLLFQRVAHFRNGTRLKRVPVPKPERRFAPRPSSIDRY